MLLILNIVCVLLNMLIGLICEVGVVSLVAYFAFQWQIHSKKFWDEQTKNTVSIYPFNWDEILKGNLRPHELNFGIRERSCLCAAYSSGSSISLPIICARALTAILIFIHKKQQQSLSLLLLSSFSIIAQSYYERMK